MAKEKENKFVAELKPMAMGVAGGIAGGYVTTMIEKQPFANKMGEFTAVIPAIAGVLLGAIFPKYKEIGRGMAVVAGTELLQNGISKGTNFVAKKETDNVNINKSPHDTSMNSTDSSTSNSDANVEPEVR